MTNLTTAEKIAMHEAHLALGFVNEAELQDDTNKVLPLRRVAAKTLRKARSYDKEITRESYTTTRQVNNDMNSNVQ